MEEQKRTRLQVIVHYPAAEEPFRENQTLTPMRLLDT